MYKILVKHFHVFLCLSIINNFSLKLLKTFLGFMKSINDPIINAGSFAGFTALHVACMAKNPEVVRILVEDLKADVNVSAKDGTQPIQILCLFYADSCSNALKALVAAGANVDTEFTEGIFLKYLVDRKIEWCSDFGEKMTLLTYAVIYNINELVKNLLTCRADYKVKSITNKTLLMHALEQNNFTIAVYVICDVIRDTEFIIARDNEGLAAIHYILHPKKFRECRFNEHIFIFNDKIRSVLQLLINYGPYIDPLINNDPETSLLYAATYRASQAMLTYLLPYYHSHTPTAHSRLLYYMLVPRRYRDDKCIFIPNDQLDREVVLIEACSTGISDSAGVIMIDLIFKLTFGMPVPAEEIKLMEEILSCDDELTEFVDTYKKDIIDGELTRKFIQIGDQCMSFHNFILQVYDNKKLNQLLRKYNNLLRIWEEQSLYDNFSYTTDHFRFAVSIRIRRLAVRLNLKKLLKKISHLRDFMPLPYEIVLDIIEYLSNNELEFFIKAFISPYPSYMLMRNVLEPELYIKF